MGEQSVSYCTQCGQPISPSTPFCSHCSAARTQPAATSMPLVKWLALGIAAAAGALAIGLVALALFRTWSTEEVQPQVAAATVMPTPASTALLVDSVPATGTSQAPPSTPTAEATEAVPVGEHERGCGGAGLILAEATDEEIGTQVYTICPDGSSLRQLTQEGRFNTEPHWSTDGQQIYYLSRGTEDAIMVMDADGNNPRPVTSGISSMFNLNFSRDGQKIAFTVEDGSTVELWVINIDGTGQRILVDSPGSDFDPAWSPDGERIVFVSDRGGSQDIFTVRIADGQQMQLTATPLMEMTPAWSHDGEMICYNTLDEPGAYDTRRTWLIPANGGEPRDLQQGQSYPCASVSSTFSPDGRYVVRLKPVGNRGQLVVEAVDRSSVTQITDDERRWGIPAWQP